MKKQSFLIVKKIITMIIVETFFLQSVAIAEPVAIDTPITSQIMSTMNNAFSAYMTSMQNARAPQQAPQLSPPKLIPSEFFPQCQVPEGISKIPSSCGQPIPGNEGVISSIQNLIKQTNHYYDELLLNQTDIPNPIGVACIERAKNEALTSIENERNRLKEMITKIKKNQQLFKENNKKILQDITDVNNELNGGVSSNVNKQGNQFKKYFTPVCQDIIGKGGTLDQFANKGSSAGGLEGMRKGLDGFNIKSRKLLANQTQIRSDVSKNIAKIKKEIARDGLRWSPRSGLFKYSKNKASLKSSISDVSSSMITRLADKTKRIKEKVGYDLSAPGGSNDSNLANILRNPKEYFANKYLDSCVAQQGTLNVLTSKVRFNAKGGNAHSLNLYKQQVAAILNSPDNMKLKLSRMQSLDNSVGRAISLKYTSFNRSSKRTQNITPYQYFQKTLSTCRVRMSNNEPMVIKTKGGLSIKGSNDINEATKLIKEVMKMRDNYATEMASAIEDRVLNCGGEKLSAGECQDGKGGILDQGGDNFCLSKAVSCSSKVSNCMGQVQRVIHQKKFVMNRMANVYNQRVAKFVASQEGMMLAMKDRFSHVASNINKKFKMSGFSWPTDLFVKMPELGDKAFGVKLRGGDLSDPTSFLKDLPSQLTKVTELLAKQKDQVDSKIKKYKGDLRGNIKVNQGKWTALQRECSSNLSAINQARKAQADAKQASIDSCLQLNMALTTPCGDSNPLADFTTDIKNVRKIDQLNRSSNGALQSELNRKIASCNNQKRSDSNAEDFTKSQLKDLCTAEGMGKVWTSKKLKEKLIKELKASIPTHLSASFESDIVDYATSNQEEPPSVPDFPDNKANNDYKKTLEKIRARFQEILYSDSGNINQEKNCDGGISSSSGKMTTLCKNLKKSNKSNGICGKIQRSIFNEKVPNKRAEVGKVEGKEIKTALRNSSNYEDDLGDINTLHGLFTKQFTRTGENKGRLNLQCYGQQQSGNYGLKNPTGSPALDALNAAFGTLR